MAPFIEIQSGVEQDLVDEQDPPKFNPTEIDQEVKGDVIVTPSNKGQTVEVKMDTELPSVIGTHFLLEISSDKGGRVFLRDPKTGASLPVPSVAMQPREIIFKS